MMFVPFDVFTANPAGTLEPGKNFAAWVDDFVILMLNIKKLWKTMMYQETWDPEGLFSTITCNIYLHWNIRNVMWHKNYKEDSLTNEKNELIKLFFWGTSAP